MCGTAAVWCWTTRWSKHDDQKPINISQRLIPRESLLRSTSKLPSRMSLAEPCCSASNKKTRILHPSFPNGTQVPQSTGCTTLRPTPKSAQTVVLIRDALFQHVVFRRPWTLYSSPLWQTSAGYMIQVPSSLPTWTTGTCGSNRSTCCRHLSSWQQPPDQSTLNCSPPRFSCPDPNSHELQYKVKLTLTLSWRTLSPAPLYWATKPPWKNHTTLFSGSPPRLLTSMVKDLTRRQGTIF